MGNIIDLIEKFGAVPAKDKAAYAKDLIVTPRFESDEKDHMSDIDPVEPAQPKQLPSVQELLQQIVENTKLSREREEPFFIEKTLIVGDTNTDVTVDVPIHSEYAARYIYIPDIAFNGLTFYAGEGHSFKIGTSVNGQSLYVELPRPVNTITMVGDTQFSQLTVTVYFLSDPIVVQTPGTPAPPPSSSFTGTKTLATANTSTLVSNSVYTPNWVVKRRSGSGTAYFSTYSTHDPNFSVQIPDTPSSLVFRCAFSGYFWTTDATTPNIIEYMQSS